MADDRDLTEDLARLNIHPQRKDEDPEERINERKAKFNQLILEGKEKVRQGSLAEALELYKKAYSIHKTSKLESRISKLKEFLKEYTQEEEEDGDENEEEEEESDDGLVDIGGGFRLAKEISESLYSYQIQALLWFWKLYNKKQGGILGDDMGLGKTIQVIAFLSGMFDSERISTALIVMPVAVIENWEREFSTWAPGIRVRTFHGSSKKERLKNLQKIQEKSGVCLTTYGMVVSNFEVLSRNMHGSAFKWDYIILDEGHKIKNPTKTSKGIRAIPARNHFILTGTPIQNNLREMWSLFDFVCQGQLLGSSKTFKTEFDNPIVRARERDASAYEKRIGNEMANSLRKLIEPHFLRRTKAEVLKKNNSESESPDGGVGQDQSVLKTPCKNNVPKMLTRKNEFTVWLHLSEAQMKIYVDFLKLDKIKELLMSTRSPLAELNVLKKICDHPRLLSAMACLQLGLNENDRVVDLDDDKENMGQPSTTSGISTVSDKVLIQESGKMVFLVRLLDNLKEEGHRTLVFSQSTKMLDIIQRVITHRGHKVLRIDGTIRSTAEREHLITTFQTNPSYTCFLLTTQVGGVGLTLTGANRVVIFDPSWNPATDAQAVDRAYRIGQTKSVVIYRLITCGSIEEKIYRKQVFKNAISQQVQATGSSKNPYRYFTSQDLRELFTLDDPMKSKTQIQLHKMHAMHRKTDVILDNHIDFLHNLGIFGISDHDLMYSQEAIETAEEVAAQSTNDDAIQARVLRAQNMVAAESGSGGHPLPSILPAPYENPKSILKPITIDNIGNESLKKKVQARLHHFEVFKPNDVKPQRFMPSNIKKPQKTSCSTPEVVDLSTPPITPNVPQKTLPKITNKPSNNQVTDTMYMSLPDDDDADDIENNMANLSLNSMNKSLSLSDNENSDIMSTNEPVQNGCHAIPEISPAKDTSANGLSDSYHEMNDKQDSDSKYGNLSLTRDNDYNESPLVLDLSVSSAGSIASTDAPISRETSLREEFGSAELSVEKVATSYSDSPHILDSSVNSATSLGSPVLSESISPAQDISKQELNSHDVSIENTATSYSDSPHILDSSVNSATSLGSPVLSESISPAQDISKQELNSHDVSIENTATSYSDSPHILDSSVNSATSLGSPVLSESDHDLSIEKVATSYSDSPHILDSSVNSATSLGSPVLSESISPAQDISKQELNSHDVSIENTATSYSDSPHILDSSVNSATSLGSPVLSESDHDLSIEKVATSYSEDQHVVNSTDDEIDNTSFKSSSESFYSMRNEENEFSFEREESLIKDDTAFESFHNLNVNGVDHTSDSPEPESDIIHNILLESPVVKGTDERQTPRRSIKSSRRKSVSQQLFLNSDSESSDDEEQIFKTPRRVMRIDSDEENDVDNDNVTDDDDADDDDADDDEVQVNVKKQRVKRLASTDDEQDDPECFSEEQDGLQAGFQCPNNIHYSDAVKIQSCACVIDETDKAAYQNHLHMARCAPDQYAALDYNLEALKLDSSDIEVHQEALLIYKAISPLKA